jgi:hypothetical protein
MGAMRFFCDELDAIDTFLGIRAWHSTFNLIVVSKLPLFLYTHYESISHTGQLVTLLAKSRQCASDFSHVYQTLLHCTTASIIHDNCTS